MKPPRVRGRALAGISVALGVLAFIFIPLFAQEVRALAWARSKAGLLLVPILYFMVELIFGASVPDLAGRWDTLPRWQQYVCGAFVLAVFTILFLVLMLHAGE